VKTQFGYHLIEVTEQHMDDESGELFQVQARHILLRVTPGNDTLAMINDGAQAFADRVDGDNFVSTAQAEGLDLLQPVAFINGRDIPALPLSLTGSQWVHAVPAGSVSRVFETSEYFYVVRAGEKFPAGVAPLEDMRSRVSLAVVRDHNKQVGLEMLNPVVGQMQMGKSMEEASAGTELVYAVSDTFGVNSNVLNVGYGTDFNKLAINGTVGTLIPEIATQRGVFALIPMWIQPVDEEEYNTRKPGLEASLLARKQAENLEEWLSAKEEAAVIEDLRFDR